MNSRFGESNLTGLASLACLFLLPGIAQAANPCLNLEPSFTSTPIAASGGRATVEVSAQAGCFREVVSHSEWIKILSSNRGYGSGSIVFQVLPDKTDAPATGFMRFAVHDLNRRQVTTLNLPIKATRIPSSSGVADRTARTKNAPVYPVNGR